MFLLTSMRNGFISNSRINFTHKSFYICLECLIILKYLYFISKPCLTLWLILFFVKIVLFCIVVSTVDIIFARGRGYYLRLCCWCQLLLVCLNGRNVMLHILIILCRYWFLCGYTLLVLLTTCRPAWVVYTFDVLLGLLAVFLFSVLW
jgi:hypothetical protein